jgi:hypothetical protein
MEENKKEQNNNQSIKIQLSLTSLMFFSPLIIFILKNKSFEILQEDREFVKWYIALWWINLALLILSIGSWILAYLYNIVILNSIYTIFISILIWFLILWTLGAITETRILSWFSLESWYKTDYFVYNKKNIILNYIPLYNIYIWYKQHNFDNPDYLIKESILIWIICLAFSFLPVSIFFFVTLFLILLRVVTLLAWINIYPQNFKTKYLQFFIKIQKKYLDIF